MGMRAGDDVVSSTNADSTAGQSLAADGERQYRYDDPTTIPVTIAITTKTMSETTTTAPV
jgi:hypothetical protein